MKPEDIGLTKDDLLDLVWHLSSDVEGLSLISDQITDTSRWSIHHHMVFEFNGKFYSTFYSEGATESQDESPWEWSEPELIEVTPVERTVTVYVPVT